MQMIEVEHKELMADARWNLMADEVQQCITIPPTVSFNHEAGFFRTIFSIWRSEAPRKRGFFLFDKLTEQAAHEALRDAFGIEGDNYDMCTYFLLLHIWIINTKFASMKQVGPLGSLWECLWASFDDHLHDKVSFVKKDMLVEDMQKVALDFIRSLGEVMNEYESLDYFAGHLKYLLWMRVYGGNPTVRHSPHLHELTVYILRLYRFGMMLRLDVLYNGDFEFPPWFSNSKSKHNENGPGSNSFRPPVHNGNNEGHRSTECAPDGEAKRPGNDAGSRVRSNESTGSVVQRQPVIVRKNPYHD
eukprot:GHVS01066152.1.p1 GENE.GHVS01066152.1~~GHVS01066152.1.p1  ORF type:complete len:302 (-),score=13.84 GHVS01066152.1:693-1598(-)